MRPNEQSEESPSSKAAPANSRGTLISSKLLRRRFLVMVLCFVVAVYISKSLRLLYVLVVEEVSGTVTMQTATKGQESGQMDLETQALWGGLSSGEQFLPEWLYPYVFWTRPRASSFYYVAFPHRSPEGTLWMEQSDRSEWRFETSSDQVEVVERSKDAYPFTIKTSALLYADDKDAEFTVTGFYKGTPYTFHYRFRSGTSAGIYFADSELLSLWENTPRR